MEAKEKKTRKLQNPGHSIISIDRFQADQIFGGVDDIFSTLGYIFIETFKIR